MEKLIYAGIGSRETPARVLKNINYIGQHLAAIGYILRSGHARGADQEFESGCAISSGNKEVYLPWRGFEGSTSQFYTITDEAYSLAEKYHGGWVRLSDEARKLMARNGYQVLGVALKTPVKFLVCWTPNGSGQGGTGQAIRIARDFGIPVFDLGKRDVTPFHILDYAHKVYRQDNRENLVESLECSSIGDRRFSALYAHIKLNGTDTTIEKIYQNAKGFNVKPAKRKGAVPDFILFNGIKMDRDYLKSLYDYCWLIYLKDRPNLLAVLVKYGKFTDRFKAKNSRVCQAATIASIMEMGIVDFSRQQYLVDFITEYSRLLDLKKRGDYDN